MATKKKMLQAAAGSAGGAGLDITEVFSTYVYSGTSAEHTITNGIDLAGEGGMIWGKKRSTADQHWIVDSERGTGSNSNYKYVMPNLITAELDLASRSVSSFNSNGFTLQNGTDGQFNELGQDYVSWTFRKAPKFFDVVTYTGDGVAGRSISHSLNGDVGTILFKRTDSTSNWIVWHRSAGGAYGFLDATDAFTADSGISNPTTTAFTIESTINAGWNASGGTYVAYLFAHNNGDGGFGPDGSDIIKCGSYTGNGSSSGNFVDLGFEPQFIIIKNSSSVADWVMFDNMRGVATGGSAADDKYLFPNGNNSEGGGIPIDFNATGFTVFDTSARTNANTNTFIYMAIRRGPLAQPESGTEVFAVDVLQSPSTNPAWQSGFPVDLALVRNVGVVYDWYVKDRLRGTPNLITNSTGAEVSVFSNADFDYMDGWYDIGTNTSFYSWMWKRAPGYFDVVAYTGNGTNPHNINHNLGVAPEMMWVKRRDSTGQWEVYYDTGNPSVNNGLGLLRLNSTGTDLNGTGVWGNTHPTDSVFTVGSNGTNQSGANFIAYLFASLPGVSKVGSFTGNGTSQDIDCGFTTAARFVLLKRTDSSGTWFILDTARGIVAGNDAILRPNTTTAEDNNYDIIDPLSSGFTINYVSAYNMNASGATYIFYAIA